MRSLAALLALSVAALADDGTMQLQLLSDPLAVCNDGSPAGYYFRAGLVPTQFVIHLQGGWYCFDANTCGARYAASPALMSSKPWTPTFTQGGITSDDILVNPQWALANAVEIPYCSSDFFAGNASSAESGLPWHFRGAHIVRAVLADLIARHGLGAAKQVVFSGTSAGGIGTLVNADAVAAALPWADVRSLADSGWFVGNQPFGTPNCSTVFTCPATVGVATGIAYWKPAEPADCLAFANASTAYQCFFGPTLRPFLTSRIYTMQYLFDAAQETFDQALPPWSTAAFEYIEATAASLVASFGATQGVFSPACFLHTMITSDQWGTIKIGDRNLPTAFADWWNGGTEHWVDTCFTPDCNKSCPV